ncbi:hypothetical protein JW935_05990 [candidate division KSB1 bacterium]|nr:hypothetical protein [candidate division KSB1 bacterium]
MALTSSKLGLIQISVGLTDEQMKAIDQIIESRKNKNSVIKYSRAGIVREMVEYVLKSTITISEGDNQLRFE